jgi:Zn-dependent metalloprotease
VRASEILMAISESGKHMRGRSSGSSIGGGGWSTAVGALALLTATLVTIATPSATAQQPGKPEAASAAVELSEAVGPGGHVSAQVSGGPVTFVGAASGRSIAVDGDGSDPAQSAQAFVQEFGEAFGETSPARDLEIERTTEMGAGGESVHYQQLERGVPVIAGELNVQVDDSGKVLSAAGELSTGPAVNTTPTVLPSAAQRTAIATVAEEAGVEADTLTASAPEQWVYDPTLIDEPAAARRLVWRTEVRSEQAPVRVEVLVDARSGAIALRIDKIMEAKNRQVCDDQNALGRSYTCPNALAPVVRSEGQGPVANTEVNKAYELSGATYDFYFSRFTRDSINGAGLILKSTVRHCPATDPCPYENAFWDGAQMVYGDTYAGADDVVGHELTHGVTENESNLVYANQSGAINESLSDIFGEFVDLTYDSSFDNDTAGVRWDMGEDLPIGAIRDMDTPGDFGQPDRMSNFFVTPNTPATDNGGVHTNSGIGNKAAYLMTDGNVTFNGQTFGAGLGITKVARIFYEVNTNILTGGSNYQALGNALNQACANLAAVGTDGITVADCTTVNKAALATEMIVLPPANDNFANATTITPTSGTTTGSTTGATRETGEPGHWTGSSPSPGTASIWFKFTAGSNGPATITTCNSNFDTILAVYTGNAVNALSRVVDNDDNGTGACSETNGNLRSRVTFAAVSGTTYRIAVDGFSTNKGAVTLNWTIPAAPAPTGISGTVTAAGTGTPIAGALLAVLKTSDFSLAGSAVADGSGNYSTQVPAGSYYLYLLDQAANHESGFFGPPTTVVVTNGNMVDTDPTMARSRGAITGTVSQDSPAGTVANTWALTVNSSTGALEIAVQANGSGVFTSPNLRAANYWMVYLDPTGAHRSEFFPNSLDVSGATPIAVTGGGTATANVSLATQTPVGSGQTLSGTITETGTGTPLQNVLVAALRSSDLQLARVVTTNASGQYTMSLTGGGYKLAFVDSSGLHVPEYFDNQPAVNLGTATVVTAPGTANATLDRRNGSLAGTVTDDTTAANVQGAWVVAIGASGVRGAAVTAANGTYTISGLLAGSYRVEFVDPLGGRTLEYFNNSPDYAGATPVAVTGGGTTNVNAALHHP